MKNKIGGLRTNHFVSSKYLIFNRLVVFQVDDDDAGGVVALVALVVVAVVAVVAVALSSHFFWMQLEI